MATSFLSLSTDQVAAFVELARQGSIRDAAKVLHITEQGVRNRLLVLEGRLGVELYRKSPIFVSLRDTNNLKGKCGVCEFRELCGGSRSRAWSVTGDVFESDPICTYEPKVLAAV